MDVRRDGGQRRLWAGRHMCREQRLAPSLMGQRHPRRWPYVIRRLANPKAWWELSPCFIPQGAGTTPFWVESSAWSVLNSVPPRPSWPEQAQPTWTGPVSPQSAWLPAGSRELQPCWSCLQKQEVNPVALNSEVPRATGTDSHWPPPGSFLSAWSGTAYQFSLSLSFLK